LLIAVVLMVGIGALFAAIAASQASGLDPGQSAVSTSLTGVFFAQLAVGVLGVLLISGEYSTGMIHSSLTVVPRLCRSMRSHRRSMTTRNLRSQYLKTPSHPVWCDLGTGHGHRTEDQKTQGDKK